MKCDVIIPVGPGHEQLVHRAVNSVAIAERYSKGLFTDIDVIAIDDTKGDHGRSKARNEGVQGSKADWLFFLDADDLMSPKCFMNVAEYQDHDAIWGRIIEYANGVVTERYQVPEIESFADLLFYDPYLTIQMGHFVRREIALENPFNEKMNTGEDWDYYLRVWKHNCIKINLSFMYNVRGEHSTGPKSANGQQWRKVVEDLIEKAKCGA